MSAKEIKIHLSNPEEKSKSQRKRRIKLIAYIGVFILVGACAFAGATLASQKTYNGSIEILRALSQADAFNITIITTGALAQDGQLQLFNLLVVPDELSEEEVSVQAVLKYTDKNTPIQVYLENGQAYATYANEHGNGTDASCLTPQDIPDLAGIINSIFDARTVENVNGNLDFLECQDGTVIQTSWSSQQYYACLSTGEKEGQIRFIYGWDLTIEIQYVPQSHEEYDSIVQQVTGPKVTGCPTLSPFIVAARELGSASFYFDTKVNLWVNPLNYDDTYNDVSLDLDLSAFKNILSGPLPTSGYRRRLGRVSAKFRQKFKLRIARIKSKLQSRIKITKDTVETTKTLKCVFVMGTGLDLSGYTPDGIFKEFGYHPDECASVNYVATNTWDFGWHHPIVSNTIAQKLIDLANQNNDYGDFVLLGHGTGALSAALALTEMQKMVGGKYRDIPIITLATPLNGTAVVSEAWLACSDSLKNTEKKTYFELTNKKNTVTSLDAHVTCEKNTQPFAAAAYATSMFFDEEHIKEKFILAGDLLKKHAFARLGAESKYTIVPRGAEFFRFLKFLGIRPGSDGFNDWTSVTYNLNRASFRVNPYCCHYRARLSYQDVLLQRPDSFTNAGRMARRWVGNMLSQIASGNTKCVENVECSKLYEKKYGPYDANYRHSEVTGFDTSKVTDYRFYAD